MRILNLTFFLLLLCVPAFAGPPYSKELLWQALSMSGWDEGLEQVIDASIAERHMLNMEKPLEFTAGMSAHIFLGLVGLLTVTDDRELRQGIFLEFTQLHRGLNSVREKLYRVQTNYVEIFDREFFAAVRSGIREPRALSNPDKMTDYLSVTSDEEFRSSIRSLAKAAKKYAAPACRDITK